jgi:hypothetical protein
MRTKTIVGPIRVWTDEMINDQGRPYCRHRRRLTLRYRGMFHEFDITDPDMPTRATAISGWSWNICGGSGEVGIEHL